MKPLLKWPGGKRWLAPTIGRLAALVHYERYVEPFVGGGAVFFLLQPSRALISDVNVDLITTYKAVRESADEVSRRLRSMSVSKSVFLRTRASQPRTPITVATRFIYLNRTAFNGIYRVNQRGEFNVPFGYRNTTRPCDADAIASVSRLLRGVSITCSDFTKVCDGALADDLVYFDPPYTIAHNNNGFRRYNEKIFTWNDQIALAERASRLAKQGTSVILSNAWHADIRRLYPAKFFHAFKLARLSRVAALPSGRGIADELLLVSKSFGSGRRILDVIASELSDVTRTNVGCHAT